MADVLFMSAILGASFVSGSAVVHGILLGVGVNLMSDLTSAGWRKVRGLLFGEPQAGLLEDDLLDALARSFQRALGHLEQQWWITPTGDKIARTYPNECFEIQEAFKLLREHTVRLFEAGRIRSLICRRTHRATSRARSFGRGNRASRRQ